MSQLSYEELVQLLQSGKIDHLQFVMNSEEHRQDFIDWCEKRGFDKTKEMAQFYLEWHTASAEERQDIENAEVTYWLD